MDVACGDTVIDVEVRVSMSVTFFVPFTAAFARSIDFFALFVCVCMGKVRTLIRTMKLHEFVYKEPI